MNILDLFLEFRWHDLVDILVVTYLFAWLYSWVKGTRAFRILLGLALLGLIYFWAQFLGLFLTGRVFEWLGQASLILVIVIFAGEIRQVLERLNPLKVLSHNGQKGTDYINQAVSAAEYLARNRIGALMVFERQDRLRELVRPGISLQGDIQREILISLFQKESPTHDGAAWIREGRILEVSVFLPISQIDLPLKYGSRHRAAVGITELSDAVVLAVSEERGEVSLAEVGQIRRIDDYTELCAELKKKLHQPALLSSPSWTGLFVKDWKVKLLVLLMVTSIWFALAGQQRSEEYIATSVTYFNLPEGYRLGPPPVPEVTVRVAGARRLLASVHKEKSLKLRVDLGRLTEGGNVVVLRTEQVLVPPGLEVLQVQPQMLQVRLERIR